MKQIALIFLVSIVSIAGCDYAKSTDVEDLSNEVYALRASIDSLRIDSQKIDNTNRSVDQLELVFALHVEDGIPVYIEMGIVSFDSVIESVLSPWTNHIYDLSVHIEEDMSVVLSSRKDTGFILLENRKTGYTVLASAAQDHYSDGLDYSYFEATLSPGEYVIVVNADNELETVAYTLKVHAGSANIPPTPTGNWAMTPGSLGTLDAQLYYIKSKYGLTSEEAQARMDALYRETGFTKAEWDNYRSWLERQDEDTKQANDKAKKEELARVRNEGLG